MSEAFEIGISLAFADGVSDGIAKAERDAAAVTRAAGDGALAVERLQKAGVAALTVIGSTALMPKAGNPADLARGLPAQVLPADSARRGDATAEPAVQDRSAIITPRAVADLRASPLAPVRGLETAAPTAAVLQAEPAAPTPAVLPDAGEAAAAPVARVDIAHAVRLDKPAASAGSQGMVARQVVQSGQAAAATGIVAPPPTFELASRGVYGGGPVPPVWSAAATSGRAALRLDHYASQRAETFSPVLAGTSTPEDDAQRPAPQGAPNPAAVRATPLAPMFVDVPRPVGTAQPVDPPGGAAGQNVADAPGAGSASATGQVQGDVFLDGTLVGRWMSRQLSREAGRASAGPTGFDSRRNALLPGGTVGG